jgi:hypothetical protein
VHKKTAAGRGLRDDPPWWALESDVETQLDGDIATDMTEIGAEAVDGRLACSSHPIGG